MKVFAINHTQIYVDLTNVCFWIKLTDNHPQILRDDEFSFGDFYFKNLTKAQANLILKFVDLYLRNV